MKSIVQPLMRSRRREAPPVGVLVPTGADGPMRRPFRLWLTGSLAVVMTAMLPLCDVPEAERDQAIRLLRHSPFDVRETLQRIELAAHERGLSVLVRLAGAPPMLVLASSVGGTLVVMQRSDSRPALPLSLMVSAAPGGGSDVRVASFEEGLLEHGDWSELPASVAADVRALPDVLARALG